MAQTQETAETQRRDKSGLRNHREWHYLSDDRKRLGLWPFFDFLCCDLGGVSFLVGNYSCSRSIRCMFLLRYQQRSQTLFQQERITRYTDPSQVNCSKSHAYVSFFFFFFMHTFLSKNNDRTLGVSHGDMPPFPLRKGSYYNFQSTY